MSNIFWFSIPAFGHTNPTIEVVRELVSRGHHIRYYSFNVFKEKIEDTGATFISCDKYLRELSEKEEKKLKNVSTTQMTLEAIETTKMIDETLNQDVKTYHPDLIVSDAVCFWGKLTAMKHNIPMICSTTTFAFNKYSSQYFHYSKSEMKNMVFGMFPIKKALKSLKPYGYHVKKALDLVQNANDTDTIVYTSELFQPFSETFDLSHYAFIGPSVKNVPIQKTERPLIYISLGTVIDNHPDFYNLCIDALKDKDIDVIISCGKTFDTSQLTLIPDNIQVLPYVNQLEVLSQASLFITHCGMNSASEGLYMGVPEILFPLTGEQEAVARRVNEMGAGLYLDKDISDSLKLGNFLIDSINNQELKDNALKMRENFLSSPGYKGGADFIESRLNV